MKDRLSLLLADKALTALRFAEIMGIQPSSVSHILSGRNNPSYDFMLKLVEKFPEISPDWIFLGQGDMYRTIITESEARDELLVPELDNIAVDELDNTVISDDINSDSVDITDVLPLSNAKPGVRVTKVILFYSDGTFESFNQK